MTSPTRQHSTQCIAMQVTTLVRAGLLRPGLKLREQHTRHAQLLQRVRERVVAQPGPKRASARTCALLAFTGCLLAAKSNAS